MCWKYWNWNSKYWFGRSVENGDHEGSCKVRRYYPKAILAIEAFWIKTLHWASHCHVAFVEKTLSRLRNIQAFISTLLQMLCDRFWRWCCSWKRKRFRILHLTMYAEMHAGFLPYWVTGSCDMPCHAQVFKSLRLKVKRHVSKTLRNNM